MRWIWMLMALMATSILFAQTPDTTATEEEEDWSLYDDLSFADVGAKRFCTSKVTNLTISSHAQLIVNSIIIQPRANGQ